MSHVTDTAVPSRTPDEGWGALGGGTAQQVARQGPACGWAPMGAGGCDSDGLHFSVSGFNVGFIVVLPGGPLLSHRYKAGVGTLVPRIGEGEAR